MIVKMIDFISEKIQPIINAIFIIAAIVLCIVEIKRIYKIDVLNQKDYIQNLEEKLNIYEQEYDEFALKDTMKQDDSYE